MHRKVDLAHEDGGVHTMSMSVGNDAEGIIFESSLVHRGKDTSQARSLVRRTSSTQSPTYLREAPGAFRREDVAAALVCF